MKQKCTQTNLHTTVAVVAVLVVLFHTNFWLLERDKTSMFQDMSKSTNEYTMFTEESLLSSKSLQEVTAIQQIHALLAVLVEQQQIMALL